MKTLLVFYWIALIILVLAGINWALFGIWHYDLIKIVVGDFKYATESVYGLVGLAAIFVAVVAAQVTRKSSE